MRKVEALRNQLTRVQTLNGNGNGAKTTTTTILPVVKAFADAHELPAESSTVHRCRPLLGSVAKQFDKQSRRALQLPATPVKPLIQ